MDHGLSPSRGDWEHIPGKDTNTQNKGFADADVFVNADSLNEAEEAKQRTATKSVLTYRACKSG